MNSDVIIIGGGQAGPAVAWALERADPTVSITLVEDHDQLAAGASTASMENFRTAWVPQCIAEQMRWSVRLFLDPDHYLREGAAEGLGVRRNGYLWLAMDDAEAAALRESVALLHSWGIEHAQFLSGDEVRYRFPWLPPHITGAKWDPLAGWLNSDFLAHRFVAQTRRTRRRMGARVRRILTEGGRVAGVETDRERLSAPVVVIAAGPGSRVLGRTAHADIPVFCIPRQSFRTPYRQPSIPASAPLVISRRPYAHFRPDGDGLLFAWSYRWMKGDNEPPAGAEPIDGWTPGYVRPIWPIEPLRDPRFPEATLYLLGKQFRQREGEGFRDPRYLTRRIGHQIGYYVYREPVVDAVGHLIRSERAILDRWPGLDGLFVCTAHAGHGIMTAPAVGEIMAGLILGRPPRIPLWEQFGLGVQSVPYEEGGGL
ncbi:MAG: FAD-binding oxidoreductase [Anaerolineae bacterium]|nr:FAD-binding oxidoreductase [Anaerolineae bacterium]